jgi:hypothetical protein
MRSCCPGRQFGNIGGDARARYRAWLPFAAMQWAVLDRVAATLGYPRPEPLGRDRT